jgi:hypothetical protein
VENPGKYPPALEGVIAKRQAFEQIHGLSVDDAKDLFGLTIEVAGGGGKHHKGGRTVHCVAPL